MTGEEWLEYYRKLVDNLKNQPNNNNDEGDLGTDLESTGNILDDIDNVNNEICENEKQKRELKDKVQKTVRSIIILQLLFFNLIIAFVVAYVTVKWDKFKELDSIITIELFNFLKYYIGATVVELLGMFLLIVKYVFSDTDFSMFKQSKDK